MTPIRVETELWSTSLLPEGLIEEWLVPDGCFVEVGDPLAAIWIEGATHKLLAPAEGWLTIDRNANTVVDPGAVIGHIGASQPKVCNQGTNTAAPSNRPALKSANARLASNSE